MARHPSFPERIAEALASRKIIAEKDVVAITQSFRDSGHDSFEYFLLDQGLVEPEDLLEVLSEYYQVPSFDVQGYLFEHERLLMFPKDVLLRNSMIPLEDDENTLVMVVANPNDEELLPIIGEYVSYDIRFFVGLARDIQDAVKEFYDESLTQPGHDDEDLREERELAREERALEITEQEIPITPPEDEIEVDAFSPEDDITK